LKSKKTNFDSISASIESVTIIILSIIYFFEQINQQQENFIYSSANFWIVLAIMVYLSGTLFLFIMARNLPEKELEKYWVINNVSNVVTNIIFCVAFLVNRFASPNPSAEKHYMDYNNIPENP
jgi:amino acid transporter